MSLLMDALKKAEEAKRHAGGSNSATASELSLRPISASEPSSKASTASISGLPDLAQHIDSLDADLAAVSTESSVKRQAKSSSTRAPGASPHDTSDRSAARNVFSAKQTPRSRSGLWLALGGCGLAGLGIGSYFWWQLQSVSGGSLARPMQLPTATLSREPAPVSQGAAPATAVPQESAASKAQAQVLLPPQKPGLTATPPIDHPAQTFKPKSAATAASADGPVRLSRTQPGPSQTLERAYDALQAGRFDDAQRDYEAVLRSDAKNTDALLGLATIASQQGKNERALAYYQLALESDPNDATAQAGVVNAKGQANPGASESRLKTALSAQPESSALHFALGNLYARQNRWSEAQQAYFRAYAIEPDNADFIFNLAVSLDHLHQNKLAAQYYQMALTAVGPRTTSFDTNQVKTRILELRP